MKIHPGGCTEDDRPQGQVDGDSEVISDEETGGIFLTRVQQQQQQQQQPR
jgi:hypothetical protein